MRADGIINLSALAAALGKPPTGRRIVALTHVHKSAGTTLIRVLEDRGPRSKCGGIYYCNWRQYRATGCQRPTDFGALTSAPASAARAQVHPSSSSTPSKQLQAQALSDALRWEADRQDFEHARKQTGVLSAVVLTATPSCYAVVSSSFAKE